MNNNGNGLTDLLNGAQTLPREYRILLKRGVSRTNILIHILLLSNRFAKTYYIDIRVVPKIKEKIFFLIFIGAPCHIVPFIEKTSQ